MNNYSFHQFNYNDTIIYRKAIVAAVNSNAKPQPESGGPYRAKIVDFTGWSIGVRADRFGGKKPLYYVRLEDILGHEPEQRKIATPATVAPTMEELRDRYYVQRVREHVFFIREAQPGQAQSNVDPIVRRFVYQASASVEAYVKELNEGQRALDALHGLWKVRAADINFD